MKIIYRKLGKEKALGQAHSDGLIEIDERLKSKKKLEIIIHEMLHILNPEFSESKVLDQSKKMSKILWQENYREVND